MRNTRMMRRNDHPFTPYYRRQNLGAVKGQKLCRHTYILKRIRAGKNWNFPHLPSQNGLTIFCQILRDNSSPQRNNKSYGFSISLVVFYLQRVKFAVFKILREWLLTQRSAALPCIRVMAASPLWRHTKTLKTIFQLSWLDISRCTNSIHFEFAEQAFQPMPMTLYVSGSPTRYKRRASLGRLRCKTKGLNTAHQRCNSVEDLVSRGILVIACLCVQRPDRLAWETIQMQNSWWVRVIWTQWRTLWD